MLNNIQSTPLLSSTRCEPWVPNIRREPWGPSLQQELIAEMVTVFLCFLSFSFHNNENTGVYLYPEHWINPTSINILKVFHSVHSYNDYFPAKTLKLSLSLNGQ